MRRVAAMLAGAVCLVLGATGCAGGGAAAKGEDPFPAAREFLSRYVHPDGRVVRVDQGGDTVSEGQAYAMLVAAGVRDWTRFDRVWAWTQRNLVLPNGLLAFHWAGGKVVDRQAASDADLDAARALLVAGCVRKRPDLRRAGVRLGRAVLAHETASPGGRLELAAGPWATGSPVTANPSYLDPATLTALARATGDAHFTRLAADGRALVAGVARPLPPDWVTVDGAGNVALSGPPGRVVPASYGFDAPRALVRLALDPSPAGRQVAARAWPALRASHPASLTLPRQLDGAAAGSARSPLAQVAAAAAASAAGDRAGMTRMLDAARRLASSQPTYYGAAWAALGSLLLTTDRLQVCGR